MPAFTVTPEEKGLRLDRYLLDHLPGWSRKQVSDVVSKGLVKVSGRVPQGVWFVKPGQEVVVEEPERLPVVDALVPVYEDAWVAVYNKPAGMVIHPSPGHEKESLEEHLGRSLPSGAFVPRAVHRLDKDTTGLILLAKTSEARSRLSRGFRRHEVTKVYRALVWGHPPAKEGEISMFIAMKARRGGRKVEIGDEEDKEAKTLYKVLEAGNGWCELELRPLTGRTHQLRLHLTTIGCAVINDVVYGKEAHRKALHRNREVEKLLKHLAAHLLHAGFLAFKHPFTRRLLEVEVPPPEEYMRILRWLKANRAGNPYR